MSLDATRWAWLQKDLRPSQKIVLLSMADRANENHECHPSISRLESDTCLDRKTVMKSISELESIGRISIIKKFGAGSSYQLIGVEGRNNPVPKTAPVPEVAPVPKTAPVPVPKTGRHQSQKRDTESTKNLPIESGIKNIHPKDILSSLGIDPVISADWIELRKQKKAAVTKTAIDGIQREAAKAGLSLQDALRICCERGWSGFKAEWVADKKQVTKHTALVDSNRAAADEWLKQSERGVT